MEKAIKKLRNEKANMLYGCDYDKLLTHHKDCVNSVLKINLTNMIDMYAYATIL